MKRTVHSALGQRTVPVHWHSAECTWTSEPGILWSGIEGSSLSLARLVLPFTSVSFLVPFKNRDASLSPVCQGEELHLTLL